MDAVGISALLGRRHFGLTVRILAQINVVCQEGLGCFWRECLGDAGVSYTARYEVSS
jgi:hypothetical protein